MTSQYPLPLPHHEAMESDDFMVTSSNREAAAWIDNWPDWLAHCLIIYGPSGAGKTHLAHVWQHRSKGKIITSDDLINDTASAIVMSNRFIAIDDAETIARDGSREQTLFHLFNMLREAKGFLLLTAKSAPAQWPILLADLRSRLSASPAVALTSPDDRLMSALLIKQFRDRQLDVRTDVLDFLLPRIERTSSAIRQLVGALDRASLAEGRRITITLAKRVIETSVLPKDVM